MFLPELSLRQTQNVFSSFLFGKMTAPSEAAATSISLATASTTIGATAAIIGAVTSKSTIISVISAGVLAVSTVAVKPQLDKVVGRVIKMAKETPPACR